MKMEPDHLRAFLPGDVVACVHRHLLALYLRDNIINFRGGGDFHMIDMGDMVWLYLNKVGHALLHFLDRDCTTWTKCESIFTFECMKEEDGLEYSVGCSCVKCDPRQVDAYDQIDDIYADFTTPHRSYTRCMEVFGPTRRVEDLFGKLFGEYDEPPVWLPRLWREERTFKHVSIDFMI
jgi:hypothetical protein